MKTKKMFAVIVATLLMLSMIVIPASAASYSFTASCDSVVKTGSDFVVTIKATAPANNGLNVKISFDTTQLTYKSSEGVITENVVDTNASTGVIEAYKGFGCPALNDADFVKITFTAASTDVAAAKIELSKQDDCLGADFKPVADVDYNGTTVAIKTPHEAPAVSVAIDGEATIGKTLEAKASAVDNWGLTPAWAYQWMVDGEAIADATAEEYTVTAADFGKKITVEATATVEADENTTASKVSDATAAVAADAEAKASVANVKLDSDVVAVGAPVMVKYDFTASINGGEDKSEIAWTAEDGSALKGTVSEDGKTFTAAIEDLGKKVKVTVTPKGDRDTAKGDAVSFTSEAIVAGNPTATNVKASVSSIRVNKAFTVEYTYSDPENGGEEAAGIYAEDKEKTVVAYSLYKDADLTEAVDKADYAKYITVEDGKYTASADAKNLYIVFEVTPVNKAGIAGETAKSEAYKITKKSSSGNDGPTSIIGGNPTTSPEPTTTPEPTKDPEVVTGGKDEIVLVINNKNASVWGEAKTNDVAPIIKNDRTMLPARFVAEALGAEVSWDEAARKVTIVSADKATTIVLTIDSDKALVNDEEVTLDSPAFIENDRTYTPIRFISENLGAKVAWDEAAQKVTITK